jgi:hypothetical protein
MRGEMRGVYGLLAGEFRLSAARCREARRAAARRARGPGRRAGGRIRRGAVSLRIRDVVDWRANGASVAPPSARPTRPMPVSTPPDASPPPACRDRVSRRARRLSTQPAAAPHALLQVAATLAVAFLLLAALYLIAR